jgi:hypothetical protein
LSRLSIRHSTTVTREENGCSCEACGRAYEAPIQLTNLSASPAEVYNACPFCFSRQEEIEKESEESKPSSLKDFNTTSREAQEDLKSPEQLMCSHYLGYLKKRPKNAPIPESCLTCPKMIQCLL